MRKDAQRSMDALTAQIAARLGQDKFDALLAALEADWGDNIDRPVAAPLGRQRLRDRDQPSGGHFDQ